MAGLDLTRMAPSDAETALRSYPRRYAEVFAPRDGEDIDDLAQRLGPDELSALDVVEELTRTWALLRDGIRRTLTTDTPVLHAGVVDAAERVWPDSPPEPVTVALDLLSDEATALADQVAGVSLEDWTRTASIADGTGSRSVGALDLLREAISAGHDGLDRAARALQSARS